MKAPEQIDLKTKRVKTEKKNESEKNNNKESENKATCFRKKENSLDTLSRKITGASEKKQAAADHLSNTYFLSTKTF